MFSLRNIRADATRWRIVLRQGVAIQRMIVSSFRVAGYSTVVTGAFALTACESPTRPKPQELQLADGVGQERFTCTVTVAKQQLSCAETPATTISSLESSVRTSRIVGGQDIYVKLTSSETSYDAGTQIFSTNVTVQNLMQMLIGTSDGSTVEGVSIFLASDPAVTSGTGSVTVANADGTGTFTGSFQPYFLYSEILEPYQISAPRNWQFNVDPTVVTFQFIVYVAAPMVDDEIPLVNAVWNGATSADWALMGNWQNGTLPADTSVVSIPRASLLPDGANQPILSADDTISDLRVGEGSTLTLTGYRLDITRHLDAPGTIAGGTVHVTGSSAFIGGNLPALEISGSARLQRATKTTGTVAVTGTLDVQDLPLVIDIP